MRLNVLRSLRCLAKVAEAEVEVAAPTAAERKITAATTTTAVSMVEVEVEVGAPRGRRPPALAVARWATCAINVHAKAAAASVDWRARRSSSGVLIRYEKQS